MKEQRKAICIIGTKSRDIEPFIRFLADLVLEQMKRDTAADQSTVSHNDNSQKLST